MNNSRSLRPCPQWAEKLAAGQVNDLSPTEQIALHEHIASCHPCAVAHSIYQAVHARVRTLPATMEMPPITTSLLKETRQEDLIASQEVYFSRFPLAQLTNQKSAGFQHSIFTQFGNSVSAVLLITMLLLWICLVCFHGTATTLTGSPPPKVILIAGRLVKPLKTPSSRPMLTNQEMARNTIENYMEYVTVEGTYRKAYNLLSAAVRENKPYNTFINDPEYTLPNGCWSTGQVNVSQKEKKIWDAWVPVTKVSCVDSTPIMYFSWHFTVHLDASLREIISVGLYPTGVGTQ